MHPDLSVLLLVLCSSCPSCQVLPPCPLDCCCPRRHLGLVLCESLGLRSLPRSVPLGTSVLSVARNHLCNVDHLLWRFSGLQELSLSHNQLPRVPRGLPSSLESLWLQGNHIAYITAGALRHLANLTRLDLEGNRIRAVQPGALLGLTRLRMLTLKGNRLTAVPLHLSSSLAYLDLSANCIAILEIPSLAVLVNLRELRINKNCLRSVPELAFDSLPHLHSVELAENQWACGCNIIYLFRWLLAEKVATARDLVCASPLHLANRLLLTVPVVAICPKLLRPSEGFPLINITTSLRNSLQKPLLDNEEGTIGTGTNTSATLTRDLKHSRWLSQQISTKELQAAVIQMKDKANQLALSRTYLQSEHYILEELSYKECLPLNSTHFKPTQTPNGIPPDEGSRCENITGYKLGSFSTTVPTREGGEQSESALLFSVQSNIVTLTALLGALFVVIGLLLLGVVLILKRVLVRNQRVAPSQQA